jgi:hypothetical protein
MFYVLDGNRRLTALKLLESPLLAEGILSKKSLKMLKRLSDQFEKTPITRLRCVVFSNRSEADPWIQLTHQGLNRGAGHVGVGRASRIPLDERQRGHSNSNCENDSHDNLLF